MTAILIGAGVLGACGLLFGLLLTLANKVFEVPSDPKRDAVRAELPGANCGGCGFAGCDALADAIAAGDAPVNACPVGGAAVAAKVAAIMGVETSGEEARKVATVVCQGAIDRCKSKFTYHGIQDCVSASLVNDGNRSCKYACLGLGTCVKACKFDAIHIDEHDHIAKVDPDKCQSCGACVAACPKHVLSLQPVNTPVKLLCRAAEQGHVVSDNCKVGCVGCEICKDACKFDAITIENHLPKINQEKCVGCMMCAESCPTGALWGDFDNRHIAQIDREACVGCGICKKVCQFEAISGQIRNVHEVNEACTGCGQCVVKCPRHAITLPIRQHVRDANAKVGTTPVEAAVPKESKQ
ncbi:MAG: RnfABCDGE type electron transport complex subunit B [Eubacteriales bacterium]|nr:RnfABCDGE type electron transport complex subunit B [Eubacteriales bacterium]